VRRKDPKYDLKLRYKKTLEVALIISLVLHAGVFLASKEFRVETRIRKVEAVVIKAEDIPITQQIKRPPPPKRPTIPVEDPDVDIDEDLTIDDTDYDILEEPPPPPPILTEEEEAIPFWAIEEKPELIGGVQAIMDYIQKNNLYPAMAQTAESNGDVIVQFTVDKNGNVTAPVIADERPKGLGFGEAAVEAMLAMKFKPGKQRDKAVPVRMQQTIRFRIK
jgi:protein TonB